jgi:hypothetical protein
MKRGKVEIPRTVYFDGYSDEQAARFEGTRQWLGYRQVDINLSSTSDKSLVDYVLEKGIFIPEPKRILIPSQVSERYHIDSLFFKIYDEQWGRLHGMCRAVASGRLSQELLYSESYTKIMREVKKRGLLKKVRDAKKKIREDWKKGIGYTISFADNVTSPEQEILRDKLKALREAEEYAKKHPSHIIIGAAVG